MYSKPYSRIVLYRLSWQRFVTFFSSAACAALPCNKSIRSYYYLRSLWTHDQLMINHENNNNQSMSMLLWHSDRQDIIKIVEDSQQLSCHNSVTSNLLSLTALAGTSNVILGLNLLCQIKSDRSQQLPSTNNWRLSLLWLSWMIRFETLCRSLFFNLEFDKVTRFEISMLHSDIICWSADDDPRPSDFR